jgi:hypothetical protein
MYGVKGDVRIQKELKPLPMAALEPEGLPPKKAVVHKKQPRSGLRGPFKGLQARVHGKGGFGHFPAVIIHLQTVEGRIRGTKNVKVQEPPEPGIQHLGGHKSSIS